MSITTYKWTIERYHRAIDAGLFEDQPVELLRGDIVVMPPEREPHAYYKAVKLEIIEGPCWAIKLKSARRTPSPCLITPNPSPIWQS